MELNVSTNSFQNGKGFLASFSPNSPSPHPIPLLPFSHPLTKAADENEQLFQHLWTEAMGWRREDTLGVRHIHGGMSHTHQVGTSRPYVLICEMGLWTPTP